MEKIELNKLQEALKRIVEISNDIRYPRSVTSDEMAEIANKALEEQIK